MLLLKSATLSSMRYFKTKVVLLMKSVIQSLLSYFDEVRAPITSIVEELRRLPIPAVLAIGVTILIEAGIVAVPASHHGMIELSTLAGQFQVHTQESTYEIPELLEDNSSGDYSLSRCAIPSESKLQISNAPRIYDQLVLTDIEVSWLSQIAVGRHKVMVAILDTGIDKNHESLSGLIVDEADFTDSSNPTDIYGHGTHVAGIIAAKNNGTGITGVAPGCPLLNVKVADDMGRCQASALAKGIVWAVNSGANVINISIEIKEPSKELEEAVNYAWDRGVVIIAAGGNYASQSLVYPAYYENCIAVSVIKEVDNLATLSAYGEWVDVAASGCDIYSSLPSNGYGYKTGSSFAAAYVSGIAALLFSTTTDINGDGNLSDEVRAAIETGFQEISITRQDTR